MLSDVFLYVVVSFLYFPLLDGLLYSLSKIIARVIAYKLRGRFRGG